MLMKNYYETLNLRKDASEEEISNNYKKLVLRWHPKFAKQDQKTAFYNFSQISEAYEVLSDPLKRSFYDQQGYNKLKQGLFGEGQLKGGYRFGNNPDEIFQKFFHSHNCIASSVENELLERGSIFSRAFGGLNYKSQDIIQDLIVQVPCSLNQLYLGVAKLVKYKRRVLNKDGRTTSLIQEQKLLQIIAGHGTGSTIICSRQGHQYTNKKISNLIFKIKQLSHPSYVRKQDDLIYIKDISLADAINSSPITINTLDNRLLRVAVDEIIAPKTLKLILNQGMPISNKKSKGNLYIKFNINFPKQIDQKIKDELRKLFN